MKSTPIEDADIIRDIILDKDVLGSPCKILCILHEFIELKIMTSVSDISIESITDTKTGQTITLNMISDQEKTELLLWVKTKLLS